MNITKCIYRVHQTGYYFYESCFKVFEGKSFYSSKNAAFYFPKTYSKGSSLVSESFPNKRLVKKKKLVACAPEGFRVFAFSTAEEYKLENLSLALPESTSFKPSTFGSEYKSVDVVHATNNATVDNKNHQVCQDLFFFRDGCVIMWNLPDLEIKKILDFLKNYEDDSFNEEVVKNESELMSFSLNDEIPQSQMVQDVFVLSTKGNVLLEKYAVSNAMALSVDLGTYEANLEKYIETMEPVTEDLKSGNPVKMSRNEVLRKTGQLFALRHNINLNSDLLDTPDFYWDREDLESLYHKMCNYFCIPKRTKVINEKINHCVELVELLSSHLNDKHHVRLEWMIIILIMVEVAFEVVHYVDRYIETNEK